MVALSNNSFSNKKSLLRPKVHSLGISNNEPTKHLLEPLTRYIQCKYSAGVKFIFAIQMKKRKHSNSYGVSVDFESLFTNILLRETTNMTFTLFHKII